MTTVECFLAQVAYYDVVTKDKAPSNAIQHRASNICIKIANIKIQTPYSQKALNRKDFIFKTTRRSTRA